MEKLKICYADGSAIEVEPLKAWTPQEPDELVVESVLIEILSRKIFEQGQKATAQELGVSPQYINDIARRHRKISERIANALGFMRVSAFKSLPSNTGFRRQGNSEPG